MANPHCDIPDQTWHNRDRAGIQAQPRSAKTVPFTTVKQLIGTATADGPQPLREYSILLVEDDAELSGMMEEFLSSQSIALNVAHTGSEGLKRALEGRFDLIILDVMLPGMDGFELLRHLRRRSSMPVIMLTARTEHEDKIRGLNAGADDYLAKPFSPDELLARVGAVLRRVGRGSPFKVETIEANGVRVNPSTREVYLDSERVDVTSIEFEILEVLVRSAGRVVSRDDLARLLYNRQANPLERALDVHVSHLRKKLERSRELIRTVRGVGYLFAAGAALPGMTSATEGWAG